MDSSFLIFILSNTEASIRINNIEPFTIFSRIKLIPFRNSRHALFRLCVYYVCRACLYVKSLCESESEARGGKGLHNVACPSVRRRRECLATTSSCQLLSFRDRIESNCLLSLPPVKSSSTTNLSQVHGTFHFLSFQICCYLQYHA